MVELFANSGDPDQMLWSVASDLGLHCLPNTLLGISRLQWVKYLKYIFLIVSKRGVRYLLESVQYRKAEVEEGFYPEGTPGAGVTRYRNLHNFSLCFKAERPKISKRHCHR